jgi:Rrf2 family iron-sulfur cluster assembly transcriptional regulator
LRSTPKRARFRWLIFLNVRDLPLLSGTAVLRLRKNGLVSSVRGPGGGYLLGKDAGSIAVGEVISAVDESVDATRCQGKGGCQGGDKCLTHALWRDLSDRLTGFLNNITLGELVNNQEVLDVSGRQHSHESQRSTRAQDAIDVKLRA